jgi:ribonuclease T2
VQLWPGSWIASDNSNYNFTNDYFTVHGVWPQDYNGSYPEFCNRTERFDDNKIESIYSNLSKYWTNFKDPKEFWKHEFQKHFTCAQNIYADPYKLFWKGLRLREKYNLYKTLNDNGIVPSNERLYETVKLRKIVGDKYNVDVVITCDEDHILEEIRLCMSQKLELMNCTKNDCSEGCKTDYVTYNKILN